jgi:hypothetical protein
MDHDPRAPFTFQLRHYICLAQNFIKNKSEALIFRSFTTLTSMTVNTPEVDWRWLELQLEGDMLLLPLLCYLICICGCDQPMFI